MQTTTLGPWNGGLNLTSNRDMSIYLQPNELGEATNIIYSKEGFIQPRPGCKVVLNKGGLYDHLLGDYRLDIIGNVKQADGRLVVIAQVRDTSGTYIYKIYDRDTIVFYFSVAADIWFNHVILYEGYVVGHKGLLFMAEQTGKSYITSDYNLSTTPTLIPGGLIPGSSGGMIVKDRLFLWKNDISRFMWSPPSYILDWSGVPNPNPNTNGDDVCSFEDFEPTTAQDGIMSVQFINNNFYIFKKTKTFMWTYQVIPKEDSYSRKINNEMGAFASTMYRNQIVLVNNRGVFRLDTTEFIDLQPQLNLRFEVPIDHTQFFTDDVFITDINNDVLLGFSYKATDGSKTYYHYCMNGYTGAWSKWTFDYNADESPLKTIIASPGSRQYRSQNVGTTHQEMFFTTFDHKQFVYMPWKPRDPSVNLGIYHLDSNINNLVTWDRMYFPAVTIKTKAFVGNSNLNYKKIYRTYIRMYISDEPTTIEAHPDGVWTLSVNYNDYRFGVDTSHEEEQLLFFFPSDQNLPIAPQGQALGDVTVDTAVYKRTYQLPIHQFRALEFVFELKRIWTSTTNYLHNPDIDDPIRPIKQGYFFMLSGIFYDFEDRARM